MYEVLNRLSILLSSLSPMIFRMNLREVADGRVGRPQEADKLVSHKINHVEKNGTSTQTQCSDS